MLGLVTRFSVSCQTSNSFFCPIFWFRDLFVSNMPSKSRAAQWLLPHTHSPEKSGRKQSRKELDAAENRQTKDHSCSSRSSRHQFQSPSRECHSCLVVPDTLRPGPKSSWRHKIRAKSSFNMWKMNWNLPHSDKPDEQNLLSPSLNTSGTKFSTSWMRKSSENCKRPPPLATKRNVTKCSMKVRSF